MFNTYVINLPEHKQRFLAQRDSLERLGIRPIRVQAYRYEHITDAEIQRHIHAYAHSFMPRSVIGCVYSHMKALELFVNEDPNEVALILEDDAFPKLSDINHLLNEYDGVWDAIFLHCDGDCPKSTSEAHSLSGSAAAYFINKNGARKLLEHKWSGHYDSESNKIPGFRKIVVGENTFWTDEKGTMSKDEQSANRIKSSSCEAIFGDWKLYDRGEKTLCHSLGYKRFRIPLIGYEVTNLDIIVLFMFVIAFVFFIRRLKK